MKMKIRILREIMVFLLVICIQINCSKDSTNGSDSMSNEELQARLQANLTNMVATAHSIHNAVLLIEAPQRNFKWVGAAGMADSAAGLVMNPADQFRTASIGKMTCATLAMKLMEAGYFALDDSIYHYLPDSIMNGLHVIQSQDYSNRITIRQLLNHRSGLADYVMDGDVNGNGLPDFLELLIAQPNKFWTPEETIEYCKQNLTPFFIPGEGFHYSDTNYQLLGLLMQRITGKTLHRLYQEMLFTPLGMNYTYLEFYDNPIPSVPGHGLSQVYFGDINYTNWTSASADWAGGGLISTCEDLNRFLRAFVNDQIFQNSQSKTEMMNWQTTGETGVYYGLGILRFNLVELGFPGFGALYGHEGFPQSFMYYWPPQNVTLVGTLNQASSEEVYHLQIILGIISLLREE
jgi:D-alanyl-D-alanine carboxypeptidase